MERAKKLLASFAAALLLFSAVSVKAQETTGTITGQVTDQSGAVVAGADLTLKHLRTGEERKTLSNEEGYYSLTLVPPGVYDLSVKATGFKEFINKEVELFVNDRKLLNVQLETGAVTETVTVTADAPIIQSSPTVGDVVENRKIVEIPLNNRSFLQLLTLVPGVTSDDAAEQGIGGLAITSISIAGNRRNSTNYLVDGVGNVDVGSNITLLSTPTVQLDSRIQDHHLGADGGVRPRLGRRRKCHHPRRRARFSRQRL